MPILSLLQLALSLLVSVQAPGVSVELRQQALDTAKQIVEIASIQITSMSQATSSQESQPEQPTQNLAQNPAPAQPQTTSPVVTQNQPNQEPVLGSAETISNPSFSVTITQVTTSTNGGEFFFTIEGKTGTPDKPELILDEVTTNLRPGQVFFKLPPVTGTTNNYRMGISLPQANFPQNPSISVKIGEETIEQPISIQ